MSSDYASIRADNERRYGTDINRIGPMLLADRYDDRAHFIFELLQNAEDALARRPVWTGSRAVRFALSDAELRVSHFGKFFDERDVRGICGIAESTKDFTSIGRFGIGFKSVYSFSDRPEVHSGDEDFAVESFVWPTARPPIRRDPDETIFTLPFRESDAEAGSEISMGLQNLGLRALLFLQQIEEIVWSVQSGPAGHYLRSKPEEISKNLSKITLIGQNHDAPDVTEETWFVFSRRVSTQEGQYAGSIQIAFQITRDETALIETVRPIQEAPLIVFFPTIVPTYLGFLIQGPYRTTPSRDNVPKNDAWNQHLVHETADLLVEALRALRDQDLLGAGALTSLPLDPAKFASGSMFAPLFDAVRNALIDEPLLPCYGGSHLPAKQVKLARTQELRDLFNPSQLTSLFGEGEAIAWVSSDITQDRMPELRQYLLRQIDVTEITPETIMPRLSKAFLEAQPDAWVLRLYEFLSAQPALIRQRRLDNLPLVRLESGLHVTAETNGKPRAFLPGVVDTDFPTARREVCASEEARKFLKSLGLTEPDIVDDVVWNLLPKYQGAEVNDSVIGYEGDIRRILTAFTADSKSQREKLIAELRKSQFVRVKDAGNGSLRLSKPEEVYLASERLKELFSGADGVLLVDDSYSCLKGEEARELLEACGVTRYLLPIPLASHFTWEQRKEMRRAAGCENSSGGESVSDYTLRGLDAVLALLPSLSAEDASRRARLLWEALADVETRRGDGAFAGTYQWNYYTTREYMFDAAFVRQLNEVAWVPIPGGELQKPAFVVFESLDWKPSPYLLSKIPFKPRIIETLAKELGIESGVLDLLRQLGVTSEADLRARLGIVDQTETPAIELVDGVENAVTIRSGNPLLLPSPALDAFDADAYAVGRGGAQGVRVRSANLSNEEAEFNGGARSGQAATGGVASRNSSNSQPAKSASGARPFISYIAARAEEEEEADGLDHAARMALEETAIALILAEEPYLQRTPAFNPGFDLFEAGGDGTLNRWVEVKAMTGSLHDRPVGMSRTQFDYSRQYGERYWLYIVEHADDPALAHIARIQDPFGKSRTYTFDHGWLNVASAYNPNDRSHREQ